MFRWLVLELLSIVREADALDLTLSKSGSKPRGTLVDALDLLRPHTGCVPAALPYKTLERLRATRGETAASALHVLRRMFPPR